MLPFLIKYQYKSVRYLKKKEFRSKLEKKNEIYNYINNGILDLEKIVNEYSNYVYKIILNITNGELYNEDIEEIISDTFFILWKNTNRLDKNKMISSYIAGIVKNLVKEKKRATSINYDISDYENTIIDLRSIDMLCEERERKAIIKKSLKRMKTQDIDIFNLYYYSGMKIKEISKLLSIPEFKTKSRLHRIRKKIKNDLEKGGYSYDG